MRVRQAQRTVSVSHLSPGRPRSAIWKWWATIPSYEEDRAARRAPRAPGRGRGPPPSHRAAWRGRGARAGPEGLGEVEVVGELGARLLLALPHLGGQTPAHPHALAQLADQVGVLREPLREDRPGAVQRGLRVGDALVRVDERRRRGERVDRRVAEQALGQRLQARLARDLRLRAPLRLERQIDVLEPRLRLGAPDLRLDLLGELALLAHRFEDRRAPLLQLPQIAQPLLEGAQLRIVEHLGRFLAVAGDEGHRRPAVEQVDGGLDLPLPYAELLGDPAFDGPYEGCRHDPVPPSPLRLRGNCGR